MKAIRKWAAALACAALAVCSVLSVSAATYTLPDVDSMSITLPDDMSAITPDAKESDPYFSLFGLDYQSTMQNFKSSNIYLQGMDNSSKLTLTVTMTATDNSAGIENYSLLSSDKLTEVVDNFLRQSEYTDCRILNTDTGLVWLNFNTSVKTADGTIKAYQANTVYDGKSVSITLQRNDSDVTDADYKTYSDIIASVSFAQVAGENDMAPYIIAGAAFLAIVVIVLVIVLTVRVGGRKRKSSQNDKIIEELADKYTVRRNSHEFAREETPYERYGDFEDISSTYGSVQRVEQKPVEPVYEEPVDEEPAYTELQRTAAAPKRESAHRYTDDEIESILGESKQRREEEAADFPTALPKAAEEQQAAPVQSAAEETVEDVTLDKDAPISEFFEDEPQPPKEEAPAEQPEAQPEEVFEDYEEVTEPVAPPQDPPAAAENENGNEEEYEENSFEEYISDEELVREEARREKFEDSDDFFEEAPNRKVIGVISSKEIADAEEYDVIGEVEKRVSEVESEPPRSGDAVRKTLSEAGEATKSFFVHCGYFAKNVKNEIKRSQARKKRAKQEEERRRRAAERAARQRRQSRNGGLVQVRSRNKPHRPGNAPSRNARKR